MLPNLGRKWATYATGAATVGAGMYGFGSGMSDRGISSNAFELLTGDPEIDNYVLGRDTGMTRMFIPLPGDPLRGIGNEVEAAGILGGGVGILAGLSAGVAGGIGATKMARNVGGRGKIASRLFGATVGLSTGLTLGAVGGAVGAYGGIRAASGGYVNSTTVSNAAASRRYKNQQPIVDGALVLGAWNVR